MDDLKIYASNEQELKVALNTVQLYSDSIGMSLGLNKCAVFHIKRGRGFDEGEDVQLVDGSILRHLGARETYKFLGVAQRGLQDATSVKKSLCSEYFSMLRRIWSSQLSGRNKVLASNMLAAPILSFTYGFIRWNLRELQEVDLKTRRILNMNQSLHKKSSLQRVYLSRHQGGRGLLNIESLYHRVVLGTCIRCLGCRDPLMKLVCEHEFAGKGAFLFQAARKAADIFALKDLEPNRQMIGRGMDDAEYKRTIQSIKVAEQRWLKAAQMDKVLHSGYFKQIEDQQLSLEWTFAFLRSNNLRSELEGFIFACQDGVIPTLSYRKNILKEDVSVECRACHRSPETLSHLVSSCPSYAATTYIYRHNAALRVLYFHLRYHYGIDSAPVLPFSPGGIEEIVENPKCRIYWNCIIPTPRPLSACKPDIVLLDRENRYMFVIEFSCPAERNISSKDREKREKYAELLSELRYMYPDHRIQLVVLIMGSLGGTQASFKREIELIPACRPKSSSLVCRIRKAVLLGSLRTLRIHGVVL